MSSKYRQSRRHSNQIDDFDTVEQETCHLDLFDQYEDHNPYPLIESLFASIAIAKGIVEKAVREAADTIIENAYNVEVPKSAIEWVKTITSTVVVYETLEGDNEQCDEEYQGLFDDQEPVLNQHEHWCRYNISVEHKRVFHHQDSEQLQTSKSQRSRQSFRKSLVLVNEQKTQSKFVTKHEIEPVEEEGLTFIDMGVPAAEDPLENGLRQAYERELQLRQIKEANDNQRQMEIKQYQQQLHRLNNDVHGRNRFTFDYEGKIMLQGDPKYDKLPTTYQSLNFNVQLEQPTQVKIVRPPVHKVTTKREQQQVQTVAKDVLKALAVNPGHYDELVLQKGVTFYDGSLKKAGPSLHNESYQAMNQELITQSLTNPHLGLKLTKKEYNLLVQNTTQQLSNLQQESKLNLTKSQPDSINLSAINQSILQFKRPTNQNFSISSMASGSVLRVNVESAIEDIISQEYRKTQNHSQSIIEQEVKHYRSLNLKKLITPEPTPTEKFHLDILSSRDWGKNVEAVYNQKSSYKKFPKAKSLHASLPMIAKFPRERLTFVAKQAVEGGGRLPPPNVGNVVGHQYKGYKLGSLD